MDVIRVLLVAAHLLLAGIWFAQLVADWGFSRARQGAEGKAVELPLMMAQVKVLILMGQIGGIGVLLTGFALLWVNGYGLFNVGGLTPTWLLIKQVGMVIALALVFGLVAPAQRKLAPAFIAAAKGTPRVTPEITQLMTQLVGVTRLVNLIVLLAVLLGVWKPAV